MIESRNRSTLDRALNLYVIKAAELNVEPDDCCQHEDRRDHCVEEELYCCIDAALVSVHADHQRHRNQRRFPEDIEEEEIERDENADHGCLEDQHDDEEFLHRTMN